MFEMSTRLQIKPLNQNIQLAKSNNQGQKALNWDERTDRVNTMAVKVKQEISDQPIKYSTVIGTNLQQIYEGKAG